MAENPRQFTSLDYNNADLYGALNNRPATGTPVNLPVLPDLGSIENNAQKQARLAKEYQDYVKRGESLVREQNEQQKLREQEFQRNSGIDKPSSSPSQQVPQNEVPRSGLSPLEQMQRSTPERSPVTPSSALPPATPNQTGARPSPLVEPTATPAPALLKEALPLATLPLQRALPRSLPQAVGRLAVPGVAAGLDLAGRLVAGQPVQQAASGAAAGAIGGGIGALAGNAIFPGLGGVVGFMIGGFIGGAISDAFFRDQIPTTSAFQEKPYINYPPFQGGQGTGALYQVIVSIVYKGDFGNSVDTIAFKCRGKILGFSIEGSKVYVLTQTAGNADDAIGNETYGTWQETPVRRQIASGGNPQNFQKITIRRDDNAVEPPDIQRSTPPPDNRPPYYNDHPLNTDATIPTGIPSNGQKGKRSDVAPSKMSNGNSRGEGNDWVPSGHLAPNRFPSPDRTPSNLGSMLPQYTPAAMPLPFAEPEDEPAPKIGVTSGFAIATPVTVTPSSGGVVAPTPVSSIPSEGTDSNGNYHDGKGGYFAPDGTPIPRVDLGSPQNSTPPTTPGTKPAQPVPDAASPIPKSDTVPKPKSDADKTAEDVQKEFDRQLAKLNELALLIGGLLPVINQIPNAIANNPNVRANTREDVATAVCDISQPGACLGSQIQQATNAANANGNRLDALNAALNAGNLGANAQLLAGQATILERLGAQIPGGIGGKLNRLSNWLHLDRVLNMLTFASTVHNAAMLSNDIGQTLLGALENVLNVIPGLKKEDGSSFDLSDAIGGAIEGTVKGIIGDENYASLTTAWAKANRIYQSTANVFNSITNLGSTILNALSLIGGMNGKIGNALKSFLVVGDQAYEWFNPQPNYNSKFFNFLENAQQGASTIQQVTQIPVDIVQQSNELVESVNELRTNLGQPTNEKKGVEPVEASQIKAGWDISLEASDSALMDSDDKVNANE